MKNVTIIELPTNLGLREPSPGKEPGVKKLPRWLEKHNFHSLLQPSDTISVEPPAYSMNLDKESQVRNADQIAAYAEKQVQIVKQVLHKNEFPLVVGGDCSVLIGNSVALKEIGTYGLFFLDGHTDFMWPSLSQTGGAAGMDLAIVTGYGHDKLTNIRSQKPYFKEEHVWCVGNREYEEWYVNTIRESSIHYIDLDSLRQTGMKKCVTDFIRMVDANNLDGYWIHIDVDVLNDDIMPAVDSRQPDGLTYPEFNELMKYLLASPKATGLEITILDPDLDPSGSYTQDFVTNFCETFNAVR